MNSQATITQDDKEYEIVGHRVPAAGETFLSITGCVAVAASSKTYDIPFPILKELQWVPENGEKYFIPEITTEFGWAAHTWEDQSYYDKKYLEAGYVCRTPEEATELRNVILKAIKESRG